MIYSKVARFVFFIFISMTISLQGQQKILFLGNSMTYYNDMPTLFQNLALAKGKNVTIQQYAPGGNGFVHHVSNPAVYQMFASQTWDVVVMQPGTGESAGITATASQTIARGNIMIDSIRAHSPCAKIILYEISNGIAANSNGSGNYAAYFDSQSKIKDTITKIAHGMHIPFSPAGEAARAHYMQSQNLELHNSLGDVHPNSNGSYLVAATLFSTLYQEPVTPNSYYATIGQNMAVYLQNLSDATVLPNKTNWLFNLYNLHAEHSITTNGLQVQGNNLSTNFSSILWNFNNEATYTTANPSHTFVSPGLKTISITVSKNGCSDTYSKDILVSNLGTLEIDNQNDIVYLAPNPASDYILMKGKSKEPFYYQILDYSGRVLLGGSSYFDQKINIEFLPKGGYVFHLKYNAINKGYQFIKK